MSDHPPEELKRRVDELSATVRGLTQELVEANERIRVLEERLDDADEAAANRHISPEAGDSDDEKSTDNEEDDAGTIEDDIIVA